MKNRFGRNRGAPIGGINFILWSDPHDFLFVVDWHILPIFKSVRVTRKKCFGDFCGSLYRKKFQLIARHRLPITMVHSISHLLIPFYLLFTSFAYFSSFSRYSQKIVWAAVIDAPQAEKIMLFDNPTPTYCLNSNSWAKSFNRQSSQN